MIVQHAPAKVSVQAILIVQHFYLQNDERDKEKTGIEKKFCEDCRADSYNSTCSGIAPHSCQEN